VKVCTVSRATKVRARPGQIVGHRDHPNVKLDEVKRSTLGMRMETADSESTYGGPPQGWRRVASQAQVEGELERMDAALTAL